MYKIVEATNKVYTIIKKCEMKWEKGNFAKGFLCKKLKWKVENNFCQSYFLKPITR